MAYSLLVDSLPVDLLPDVLLAGRLSVGVSEVCDGLPMASPALSVMGTSNNCCRPDGREKPELISK